MSLNVSSIQMKCEDPGSINWRMPAPYHLYIFILCTSPPPLPTTTITTTTTLGFHVAHAVIELATKKHHVFELWMPQPPLSECWDSSTSYHTWFVQ